MEERRPGVFDSYTLRVSSEHPTRRDDDSTDPTLKADSAGSRASLPHRSGIPAPPDVASAPASARFGKFVRTQRLGAGGMGEVWKAWDTQLSRWVALKFLKGSDDEEIARFEREAQVAARLNHPHIAAIYEVGVDQDRHFIAMQFIDGRTLRHLARTDLRLITSLIHDAAKAAAFANDTGIVHRDIKPENLMVVSRGADHHLFVMDFGLARATEGASDLSVSGSIVGTPAYMPPEQARGERADARADVYSLGATLYELAAGRKPFAGATVYETLKKVQEDDPTPPRRLNPKIDAELETIILKCLEKERDRRYATATDLADDLDAWRRGEPISAVPPSATYRFRKFVARRKAVIIPAILAAAVVLAAFAWWISGAAAQARKVRDAIAEATRLEAGGDLAGARDRFRLASELAPANLAARDGIARVERVQQEALTLVESGRAGIDRAELYLRDPKAKYEELIRRVDEGQARIEEALKKAPRLAVAHYLLGRAWDIKGWEEKAEAAWHRAIELDPALAPAHVALGRLHFIRALMSNVGTNDESGTVRRLRAERHGREAIACFETAATSAGDDDPVLRLVGEAMMACSRQDFPRLSKLLDEGVRKYADREGAEELWFIWGLADSDAEQARAALARALEIRPNHAHALLLRAIKRQAGDFEGAIMDATRALTIRPRLGHAWFLRGRQYFELGRWKEAEADFSQALAIRADWAEAFSNRGAARFNQGRISDAMADLDESLRLEPTDTEAFSNFVVILKSQSRFDEALAACDRFEKVNPTKADGQRLRGDVLSARGDREGAVRAYDEALRIDPRHYVTAMNRAVNLWFLGRKDEGLRANEQAIAIDPKRAEAWVNRAQMLHDAGQYEKSIEAATEAIRLNPRDAGAYLARAGARRALGDEKGAQEDTAAAARNPNTGADAGSLNDRGAALLKGGDIDAALAAFDQALRLDPRHLDALRNRSGARILKGDHRGAIEDADAGLRLKPDSAPLLYHRGFAKFCLNDNDGAWADFEAALKIDPNHADALNLHAVIRGRRGDNDGAIEELKRVVSIDPDHLKGWNNLGTACNVKGDADGSIQAYTQVIRLDPKNPDAWYNRAAAYAKKNDHPACARDIEAALKVAPADWRNRAEAERNLKALRGG
jgi:tetratricopeptide (TPR) repeat protein/predicted Ser/Thr protein kinase